MASYREFESVGKVLCRVRYRFVFIDPVMLPPSSLIMRLHGYPRGTDSRVKKMEQEGEERKRNIEKSRALALSDPTFHDRLMWDRAAIKYGEEVTAPFIARVMDH